MRRRGTPLAPLCRTQPRVARSMLLRMVSYSVRRYPHIFTAELANQAVKAEFAIPSREKDHWDHPSIVVHGPLSTRELLPEWMHFLHGEVTFTDPRSLHVNAEFRKQMTSMFLDVLAREKQQAPEKYNEFWELYRDQVLEGISTGEISIDHPAMRNLLLFRDTYTDRLLTLDEWAEKKGETPSFSTPQEKEIFTSASALLAAAVAEAGKTSKQPLSTPQSTSSSTSSPAEHPAPPSASPPPPTSDADGPLDVFLRACRNVLAEMGLALRRRAITLFLELLAWFIIIASVVLYVWYTEQERKRKLEEAKKREEEDERKRREEERARLGSVGAAVNSAMRWAGLK